MAGGLKAVFEAKAEAEDDEALAISELKKLKITKKDLILGITASGTTSYTISAVTYDKEKGLETSCLTNVHDSVIGEKVTYPIEVDTGSEIILGSTRLKSATAQKMVLNMLSTGAMIINHRVYKNYPVEIKPTNEKWKERCVRIVCLSIGCNDDFALNKLKQSNWNVKIAILMGMFNVDKKADERYLERGDGRLII